MANLIKFEGADEFEGLLSKAFKQAPDIANKIVKNTTEKGMAKAKRLAPRDTWFLHDSIYTEYKPLSGYVHSPASYSGCQGSPIETDQKRWKPLILKLSFEVGTWYNKAIRKVVLLCLKPWTLRKEKVMGLMI